MTTRKRRERKRVSNLIGMDTGGLNDLLAGAKVKKQPSKIKSAPRTRVTRSTSGGRVAFSAPALVTLSDKSDSAEIRVKREKTDVKSESVRRVSKRIPLREFNSLGDTRSNQPINLEQTVIEHSDERLGMKSAFDEGNVSFLQLPGILPMNAPSGDGLVKNLAEVGEGQLGQFVFYRSGRVTWKIGEVELEIERSTPFRYRQEFVSLESNELAVVSGFKDRFVACVNTSHLDY